MIDFCNYKWTTAMEGGRIIHTGQPWMWYDDMQVNEFMYPLTLSVQRINKRIKHWDGKIYNPTIACGLLRSVDTFGYGTFSAEIQLPKGKNLWPSFWLVGEGSWPAHGEIDIMEAWSGKCGNYFKIGKPQPPYIIPLTYWDTTTNIHWQGDFGMHDCTGSKRLPLLLSFKNPTKHFVKYEVEWRPNIIYFKVNGKTIDANGTHIASNIYGTRQHVIFNLWTTGLDYTLETPMMVRNFEYKPLEIL